MSYFSQFLGIFCIGKNECLLKHTYTVLTAKTNTVFFLIERKLKNINLIISALLTLFWLSAPGSVIIASGQGHKTNVSILEGGCNLQCPSVGEREATRNEIIQIANSAILKQLASFQVAVVHQDGVVLLLST